MKAHHGLHRTLTLQPLSCLHRRGARLQRSSFGVIMAVVPLRLRGVLHTSDRGFLLETDDGHVWRLSGAEDLTPLEYSNVIVEARKVSNSLLDVLWIGSA